MCLTVSILINKKLSYLHQSTSNSFSHEVCFYFLCENPLERLTEPHDLAATSPRSLRRPPRHVTFSPSLGALSHQSLCCSFFPQTSAPSHPSHLYCSSCLVCQDGRGVLAITPTAEPLTQTLWAPSTSPPFYRPQSTILYVHGNVLFRCFCF